MRSDSAPQPTLASAIARKPIVIAVDKPVTDHPVAAAIGRRNTGRENREPMARHPSTPPLATITQRYECSAIAQLSPRTERLPTFADAAALVDRRDWPSDPREL